MRRNGYTRRSARSPVLVLGIGNVLLRDEGVGVRVIEAMRGMGLPEDVEVCDGATAGMDLLDVISNRRKVIIADAMDIRGEPGAVLRLKPDDLMPDDTGRASLHEFGLVQVLAAARHLGCAPDDVVVFGVKPGSVGWGTELSPEVARKVPEVVGLILAELAAQPTL